jgi:hypothetical protein
MSLSACQESEVTLRTDPIFLADNKPSLPQLADQLMSTLEADGIAIAICLPLQAEYLMCILSRGELAPPLGALLEINSGISGRCIRESRMLHSYDTNIDPRVDPEVCERMGIRSLAVAPLFRNSQCIGVIEVLSRRPAWFEGPTLSRFAEEAISLAALVPLNAESNESALLETEADKVRGESIPDEELTHQGFTSNDPSEVVPDRETSPRFTFHTLEGDSSHTRHFASRYLPWLAASAAALILGFVAPRFVSRIHGSATPVQKKILGPAEMAVSQQQSEQPTSPAEPVSGTEVPDERKRSTEKLLADAKAGDPIAQFFLGVHYLNGSGVEQDRVAAAAWYIIAGVNGNLASKEAAVEITRKLTPAEIAETRFRVGKMFLDGMGTSRDVISAYSWFALAKAAGNPGASKELQEVSKEMTPEQLSEARLRATRWLNSHGIKSQLSENQILANTALAR